MVSGEIASFLNFLQDCTEKFHINRAVQHEKENLTQDILHEMELGTPTYHELGKLSKRLQAARRERREAKDASETLEPIVLFLQQNQGVIRVMEKLLGDVRKVEKRHENRIYIPKVKKPDTA